MKIQLPILSISYQNDASITHPGTICDNLDTISLSGTDAGGIWSGMQINPTTGIIDISALGNGNYNYIYSIPGTCPDSDTLNLDVFEFIEASINAIPDFVKEQTVSKLLQIQTLEIGQGYKTLIFKMVYS